jgi:hypothetical protein
MFFVSWILICGSFNEGCQTNQWDEGSLAQQIDLSNSMPRKKQKN